MIPKSIMENGAEERVESVRIYSSKCVADVGGVMWTPVVLMETMWGNVGSAGRRTSFVPLPDLEPSAFCQRVKERFTRGSLRCRRSLVPGNSAPLCDRLKDKAEMACQSRNVAQSNHCRGFSGGTARGFPFSRISRIVSMFHNSSAICLWHFI